MRRCLRHPAATLGLVVALVLIAPASARATWPGRDGLLALAPVHGGGILLAAPDGRLVRRVCPRVPGRCEAAPAPAWSPDGRKLAFGSTAEELSIVYEDGTCLDCGFEYGDANTEGPAVFDSDSRKLVFRFGEASAPGLWTVAEDGIGAPNPAAPSGRPLAVAAGGFAPAVSVDGRLAFVRRTRGQDRVFVTNRVRTRARAVAPGDAPSFSPDGRALAFDHRGWVQTIALGASASAHAIARGSAPAWSPSGGRLAFVGPGGYLSVVPAGGGTARRLGHVRVRHVDWQPIVAGPPRCDPPAGSRVVLQAAQVTITHRTDAAADDAFMACWRPRGVLRLLDRGFGYYDLDAQRVFGFASAGRYVAFQQSNFSGGEASRDSVVAFDLARGQLFDDEAGYTDYGGPSHPPSFHTAFGIDSLLVGSGGVVAWLARTTGYTTTTTSTSTTTTTPGATSTTHTSTVFDSNPFTTYEIDVHQGGGRRVLDSAVQAGPAPPLADLQVSGATVRWLRDGQPRSAAIR